MVPGARWLLWSGSVKMADRRLRSDEADLWQHVTDDVRLLDSDRRNLPRTTAPTPDEAEKSKTPASCKERNAHKVHRVLPDHRPSEPLPVPGPDAGIDRRTLLRLKRGRMKIDDELDLHDHSRDAAYRALYDFVQAAYDTRRRCVLVITGKGIRTSGGNPGVLRQAVPTWLARDRLRQMVVSWQLARPQHGGDGALYVLIRRRRE